MDQIDLMTPVEQPPEMAEQPPTMAVEPVVLPPAELVPLGPDGEVDRQAVFDALKGCLEEVIGADVVSVMKITEKTKIFTELGVTSMDMMRLMEMVNERYQIADQIPEWVGDRSILSLSRTKVSDVVDLVINAVH